MDARYEIYRREEAYRFYIADTLYYHGQNMALTMKYGDLLNVLNKPIDNKPVNGDEIVQDIMSRHGLRFKDDDSI